MGAIGGGRLDDWVSLIIDIESCASSSSSVVTELRTFVSVVSFKSVEALKKVFALEEEEDDEDDDDDDDAACKFTKFWEYPSGLGAF